MKNITVINRQLNDLNPIILGEEKCEPSHSFGPATRKYTLIHFVVSGCGTFCRGGIEYPVRAGEAFIIQPGEITTYCASEDNPWHYRWIGFDGELAQRFASLEPVFPYSTDWANEMLNIKSDDSTFEYRLAAKLFSMYAEFFADKKYKNDYVKTVTDYISALYIEELRIEDIAKKMNLDRRYLSRIFKERTGKTIQDYLIEVRIDEAKKLLMAGQSVADAALLCGYSDICNFSKMFKRLTGTSPGKWKSR